MRKMIQRAKNQKGFTLVELMVVVLIIGILVMVAIPVFNNVQDNARKKAHDSNVRILQGAATMYVTSDWDGAEKTADQMKAALENKYIDGTYPENPTESGAYEVTVSSTGVVTVTPGIGDYAASAGGGS